MLTIRLQRTGRKGHAMFRIVVQDSRQTPTSGKVVAQLGTYDPHAKTVTLDKEKANHFLKHGAQPSERIARILAAEGIKLPKWVTKPVKHEAQARNPEKLRKNRPAEPVAPAEPETESAPEAEEAPAAESTEAPAEVPVAEESTEEKTEAEAPAEPETATEEPVTEKAAEEALAEPEEQPEPPAEAK